VLGAVYTSGGSGIVLEERNIVPPFPLKEMIASEEATLSCCALVVGIKISVLVEEV